MRVLICQTCGAPASALMNPGTVYFIEDSDVPKMRALIDGELDTVACEACGTGLGVEPTIGVRISKDSRMLLYLSPLARPHADAVMSTILMDHAPDSPVTPLVVTLLDSLIELRTQCMKNLLERVRPFSKLATIYRQNDGVTHMGDGWKSLTKDVFTGAGTLLMASTGRRFGDLVGIGVTSHADQPDCLIGMLGDDHEVMITLALVQADVLTQLYVKWVSFEIDHGDAHSCERPSLRADLDRYIGRYAVVPGVFELVLDKFETIFPSGGALGDYVREAIFAHLCLHVGAVNPRRLLWVLSLVEFELAYAMGEDDQRARLGAFQLSEQRCRDMVGYDEARLAFDRVISDATVDRGEDLPIDRYGEERSNVNIERLKEILPHVHEIASRLGRPDLVDSILHERVRLQTDNVRRTIQEIVQEGEEYDLIELDGRLLELSEAVTSGDLSAEQAADFGANFARRLTDPARSAVALAWTGNLLIDNHRSVRALNLVEFEEPSWQQILPVMQRVRVMRVRAVALASSGDYAAATIIWRNITVLLEREGKGSELCNARVNLAITTARAGDPASGLKIFDDATAESSGLALDSHLLRLRAEILAKLDRVDDVIHDLYRARKLALNNSEHAHCSVLIAQQLAVAGRHEEARQLLHPAATQCNPLGDGLPRNYEAFYSEVTTWLWLVAFRHDLPANSQERVDTVIKTLRRMVDADTGMENHVERLWLLRRLATFADYLHWPDAGKLWINLCADAKRLGLPSEPEDLIQAARFLYAFDDRMQGRAFLRTIPQALTASIDVCRLNDFRASPVGLRRVLALLGREVSAPLLNGGMLDESLDDWADIRLSADLQRQALGRAGAVVRGGDSALESLSRGLTDDTISSITVGNQSVAVIDWAVVDNGALACYLTVISGTGNIRSSWVETPLFDLEYLAAYMTSRLANWRPGRRGDPLDVQDWSLVSNFLMDALSAYLQSGDHVVIIDHQLFSGLPWHVPVSEKWTCSYETSWLDLLATASQPIHFTAPTVGVLTVPRYRESTQVLTSLLASQIRTVNFARRRGMPVTAPKLADCDRDAFARLMEVADVAKILCHGYVDPAENEVSLMLAANGILPLASSVASGTELGRLHQFGLRDCRALRRTSPVVFSAACSSGLSHTMQLGEKAGLMTTLRRSGTRSLIAPRWDIVAEDVLPVLDDALERWLTGTDLANALRDATQHAVADGCPKWLAASLTLEGQWR